MESFLNDLSIKINMAKGSGEEVTVKVKWVEEQQNLENIRFEKQLFILRASLRKDQLQVLHHYYAVNQLHEKCSLTRFIIQQRESDEGSSERSWKELAVQKIKGLDQDLKSLQALLEEARRDQSSSNCVMDELKQLVQHFINLKTINQCSVQYWQKKKETSQKHKQIYKKTKQAYRKMIGGRKPGRPKKFAKIDRPNERQKKLNEFVFKKQNKD